MEMEEKKKLLIDEFIKMSKGRSSDELLPLILAVSNKAKQMDISFSKDEVLSLVTDIKKDLNSKDSEKIDILLKLFFD